MSTSPASKRDLIDLEGHGAETITALLDAAARFAPAPGTTMTRDAARQTLAGRVVANLFLEDSTRTRCSFALAAQRLGAIVVDLTERGSSVSKGETLADTARTIEAMGVDALVVRHAASGAPTLLAHAVRCPVINAGDGRHAHPTQGLLDLLALRERLGRLQGKHVAIVGDIGNSRVARSTLHGLVALGASVTLVGPPTLVPRGLLSIGRRTGDAAARAGGAQVKISHDLDAVLPNVDAVMMLRVQLERAAGQAIASDYRQLYGLSADRVARLPSGAPILHPGPMNRGVEIDDSAADHPQRSLVLRQVALGVAVRMAVLQWSLDSED